MQCFSEAGYILQTHITKHPLENNSVKIPVVISKKLRNSEAYPTLTDILCHLFNQNRIVSPTEYCSQVKSCTLMAR